MTVELAGVADRVVVLALVDALLRELGEEGEEAGQLDHETLGARWFARPDAWTWLVRADDGEALGVLTAVESFAIYAGGPYGVINETYVVPAARGARAGRALLHAVKHLGRERGWSRIDVTAPENSRWARTRAFYEREGFVFTGPKLKFALA